MILFLLLTALCAYLLMVGKLSSTAFVSGLLVSALATGVIHNLDVLSRIVLKGGGVEASVEVMRELRDEVFAKATQVRQLAEQMAAMTAWGIANTGRFVGDDFQEQLLERRRELRKMLGELSVPVERREQLVLPITAAVARDYRQALLEAAWRVIVDSISGTDEQRKGILHEIEQALRLPDQLTALEQVEQIIVGRRIEQPVLRKALDRYRAYLRENAIVARPN